MAPWFRGRRGAAEPTERGRDRADLDDDAHAWWAQREAADLWRPREAPLDPEPTHRDVMAEEFGPDWHTSFEFLPPLPAEEPIRPAGPVDTPIDAPVDAGSDIEADAHDDDSAEADADDTATVPEDDGDGPYAVLGVELDASWDDIVAAHRRLARRHHPDRQAGRAPAEVEASAERIRLVNAAYAELRVRRGR